MANCLFDVLSPLYLHSCVIVGVSEQSASMKRAEAPQVGIKECHPSVTQESAVSGHRISSDPSQL